MWALILVAAIVFEGVVAALVMRIVELEVRLKATEIQVRALSGVTNGVCRPPGSRFGETLD